MEKQSTFLLMECFLVSAEGPAGLGHTAGSWTCSSQYSGAHHQNIAELCLSPSCVTPAVLLPCFLLNECCCAKERIKNNNFEVYA